MKKLLLTALLFSCISVYAQEESPYLLNEIKISPSLFLQGMESISYERIVGEDGTVGIELLYDFTKEHTPQYKSNILAYYRLFFSNRENTTGLFVEWSVNRFNVMENSELSKGYAGLGIALGGKFVNKNKWVVDIFLGYSRTIDVNYYAKPRMGLSVGRRF